MQNHESSTIKQTGSNITLVLGGARSGKSSFAEKCCCNQSNVLYFATAQVLEGDSEMKGRISKHVARRPPSWETMEPPSTIDELQQKFNLLKPSAIIIDCATLWLGWELTKSHQLYSKHQLIAHLENQVTHFVQVMSNLPCPVFVVSNETGCGIVPEHASGRIFRDLQGILNARLATEARFVCLVVAGQALLIKNTTTKSATTGEDYFPIAAISAKWMAEHLFN